MSCYKITIAYRGTAYCGWQVQENALSVCEAFQDAVEKSFGMRGDVKGCSRTDAGVHANGFVLRLKLPMTVPEQGIQKALNTSLPKDIVVKECTITDETFHPRYDCTGKEYLYRIYNAEIPSPFLTDLALWWKNPLDELDLNRQAKDFIGTYDYTAFCASGSSIPEGQRTRSITEARIERKDHDLFFYVRGDGFLYNMVRIMTGTLLDVAGGQIRPDTIKEIILSKDRSRAGFTAPPQGLYLNQVFYED